MSQLGSCVLFLGSGATKASTVGASGPCLPTDRGFFDSELVTEKLEGYPALKLVRSTAGFKNSGLYTTWNELFVYRGLARAGVVREECSTIEAFDRLANHSWSTAYQRRTKHYASQFQIMEASHPREYYLAELAIWDLRDLVKEVYGTCEPRRTAYCCFWDKLTQVTKVTAVVNLNYDTTFDDALTDHFFCPGDGRVAEGRIPLIRPHGSLEWTSRSQWSIPEGRWLGWTDACENTDLTQIGYASSPNPAILDFRQPLIVAPAMLKEEVVGSSSASGLNSSILKQQWHALETALRACHRLVIIGWSVASGDDHLAFLLKRSSARVREVHPSCVEGDTEPIERLCEIFGASSCVCPHYVAPGSDLMEFFNKSECHLTRVSG